MMPRALDEQANLHDQAAHLLAGEEVDGGLVLRGTRPPILDGMGLSALLLLLVAGAAWYVVRLRGLHMDPLGLLALFVAVGATARALTLAGSLLPRLRMWWTATEQALVLLPDGLVWRSPDGEVQLPRASIATIYEEGEWQRRSAGRRYGHVWVVAEPQAGQALWALPPLFDETPGMLATRLSRWLGEVDTADRPAKRAPVEDSLLPSARYGAAAAGEGAPGVAWIRHGHGWLRRGPFAGPLLAAIVVPALAQVPSLGAVLMLLGLVAIAVPLGWFALNLRDIRPRKGLSLVLTPQELLLRTRGGMLRTEWSDVLQIHVDSSPTWSLLEGFAPTRRLVISRRDDTPIRYDEAYLGLPAEVVQRLLQAYRKGTLPRPTPR